MKTATYDPATYWERRYRDGRTSGAGSEGDAAVVKARIIEQIIDVYDIASVIDWGVGDGVVLGHLQTDVDYLGLDVAPVAIERLRAAHEGHPTRRFALVGSAVARRDLALSLDVMFHLVDERDYRSHLNNVFGSAARAVLIHANDHDGGRTARHVLWRRWTPDVAEWFPDWSPAMWPAERSVPGWHLYLRNP